MPSARGRVPLARAMSKRRLASRQDAIDLIRAGRVTVNGRRTTDPGALVVPERDRLAIDGLAAAPRGVARLVALHKPRGVVTSRRDPRGRPTVFDLLGAEGADLVAVGRLDLASSGLLLLTNDTALAHRLTDPARGIVRRYVVTVRGEVSDDDARQLERGIAAGASGELLRASQVIVRKRSRRETHLLVELTEGRNREIRRLFDAIGHEVTRLLRVAYGDVELGALQPGEWRVVN